MLLPNLPPPVDGIRHQSRDVAAYISQRCLGTGTIYIAESRLSWAKDGAAEGLSLEYPHIAVHATSRDPSSFQFPCLYLMVDICLEDTTSTNGDSHVQSDEEEDHDEENDFTEIRFVPHDPFHLEVMYKALNECQELHPDPEANESDEEVGEFGEAEIEEEGDDFAGPMQGGDEHYANGNGHLGDDDNMDVGQYDDADQPEM